MNQKVFLHLNNASLQLANMLMQLQWQLTINVVESVQSWQAPDKKFVLYGTSLQKNTATIATLPPRTSKSHSDTAIVRLVHFNRLQQKMSSSTTLVSGDNYPIPHFVCAGYVATPYHSWLLADMVLSHSVSDLCLVGPRGCGKSALVRQLAASLGYQTETIQLYQVTLALAIRQRPSSCTR